MSLPCCPTAFTCSTCSVASGNIRDPYNVASFSGRGTSFDDGRIKPDLVAPGEDILSAAAPGADSNGSLIPTQPNYCGVPSPTTARTLTESQNVAVSLKSGTSMATPLVAGAVEKIRQYFKQGYYPSGTPGGPSINPDESLLRAVILASAKPLSGSGGVWNKLPFQSDFSRYSIPVNSQIPGLGVVFYGASHFSDDLSDVFAGFGMPILDNAVSMPDGIYKMFFTSETFQASSGPSAFAIPCDNQSSTPVTIVLAWTDPPGSTSSRKQLVNDLDLIVLVPSSTSSSAQLFGNMRDFADSSNVVERVICACPAGGSLTAIVLPGEAIKTAAQKWNLVANGPISSSITKLESVPIFKAGRIAAPATTPASCVSSSRLSYSLNFVPGREWLVPSSSWEMQRLLLEFSVSLSIFARVNRQAISISLTLPCSGCSPSFATLSLGCSTLITMSSSGLISFEYITASALYSALRTNCDDSESPCQRDPILSAFDWTEFAAAPYFCNSYVTCGTCTSAAACGWCASRGTCKSGNALGSDDGRCASLSTWNWNSSACSSPAPPPPTPDAQMAVFVFRIADRSIESWTGANTQQFENEMQSLLKDSTNIFKVTKIRSGSVILDSQVSTTASMLPAINTVFTNLDLLRQLPAYGSSLSVVAVPPQSACSGFTALETCVASSACGWCSVVESCLPGSKDGATVPPGSDSTCTGDNWKFEISHSCASLYIVVSQQLHAINPSTCLPN